MSFKPEVIADDSGKWTANALRFETEKEAALYNGDLSMRWTAVREIRVVECDDPVTARIDMVGEHQFKLVHLDLVQAMRCGMCEHRWQGKPGDACPSCGSDETEPKGRRWGRPKAAAAQ
jgi:rubrerythrin